MSGLRLQEPCYPSKRTGTYLPELTELYRYMKGDGVGIEASVRRFLRHGRVNIGECEVNDPEAIYRLGVDHSDNVEPAKRTGTSVIELTMKRKREYPARRT